MKALIPAADRGTRLGERTETRPKGLVEVTGRPLLAHVFETAVDAGADELVVVIGYEGAQIIDRFDDPFAGVPITYVHQREQLGLGHAVLQAAPHTSTGVSHQQSPQPIKKESTACSLWRTCQTRRRRRRA